MVGHLLVLTHDDDDDGETDVRWVHDRLVVPFTIMSKMELICGYFAINRAAFSAVYKY